MVSHSASSYNAAKVNRQFQIVISKGPSVEESPPTGRLGGFCKIRHIFAGALFLAVAFAVLIFVLILGSILAAIIWIAFVAGIAVLILKATLRRVSGLDDRTTPSP